MKRAGVLFVDDERGILATLGRLVRTRDYASHFMTSPAEALEFLKRHREIGVVVSDHSMPHMTGVQFLSRVAELRPGALRLLLTANADAAVLAGAINSGSVYRYISKPWVNEQLLAAVDSAVEQADILRENRRLRLLTRRSNKQLAALNAQLEVRVVERTRKLAEANVKLREAASGLARLLAVAAERGEPDLSGLAEVAARTAVAIGRRMGMSAAELDDLRMASMLHDVGRIGGHATSDASDDQNAVHAERGARMLEPLPFSCAVVTGVKHHHERWDGTGGPDGLRGKEIPKIACVVAVAVAHAAMLRGDRRDRPLSAQESVAELITTAGRTHDPAVVAALMDVVADTSGPGRTTREASSSLVGVS